MHKTLPYCRKLLLLATLINLYACASSNDVHFAAIGDTPYYESDTELENVSIALNQMADKGLPFVVHVGDIIRSGTACSEALFQLRANIFSNSPIPFIITIGDNEFNDCKNPLLARENFREVILGNPDINQLVYGRDDSVPPLALTRQKELIENAYWKINDVTFVMLVFPDMPGTYWLSNTDREAIISANIAFMKKHFRNARRNNDKAIVLIMHANPVSCGLDVCARFLEAIKKEVVHFSKPVLWLNGSIHEPEYIERGYFDIPNLSHLRPGNEPEVLWPEVIFSAEHSAFSVKWHQQAD